MLWDTELENKIKLGVQYPFDALEKGECILNKKLEKHLKIGDEIKLRVQQT